MIAALEGAATSLARPALRAWLRRRVAAGKEDPARLPERWGEDATTRPPGKLLWLHAASVGEAASMRRVLLLLPPELRVLFTTGTVTSAAMLAKELSRDGPAFHRFVPLDVPAWVGRFLDHWRPDAAAFVESEIWPTMLAQLHRRNIPVALINARFSAKSYRSWRLAKPLAAGMFRRFAAVQAQTQGDAARLAAMGARPGLVGNLKLAAFPLPVDPMALTRLRRQIGGRPCWVAAQTHPGEEAIAASVHGHLRAEFPDLLTIIVPRHPERGTAIVAGLPRPATRRGAEEEPPPSGSASGGFYVADTMGELGLFYRAAACAFVGKSLAVGGGQNPLEPARLGCPAAVGPMVANFTDAVELLRDAGGLAQVADAAGLAEFVAGMLRDPARRAAMAEAGRTASEGEDELPAKVASLITGLAGMGATVARP